MDLTQAMKSWRLPQSSGGSKIPATAPKPVNYGRTAPGTHMQGLSDKMRSETAQALEQMLKHGSFLTGLEPLLLKVAQAMQPMPKPVAAPLPRPGGGLLRRAAVPLGIGALVGGYGLMRQHEDDVHQNHLTYTPLQGVY